MHDALRPSCAPARPRRTRSGTAAPSVGSARSAINTDDAAPEQLDARRLLRAVLPDRHRPPHRSRTASLFPHLRRVEPGAAPIVDRLQEEHEVIADLLDQLDRALVHMVENPDGPPEVEAAIDLLSDTLLSHLAYEERELIEPIARLPRLRRLGRRRTALIRLAACPRPPQRRAMAACCGIPAFRRLWIGLGLSSLGDWLGLLAITAMASALAPADYGKQNYAIGAVLLLRVLPALCARPARRLRRRPARPTLDADRR